MTAMMAAALLMTGCAAFQNMSKTGQGATIGGGGGAVAGAAIGAMAGGGKGAAIGTAVGAGLGAGVGALIGRRGETLDAIQQLTSYSVNRTGSRVRVQLDAENYRAKREQSLERLANKVAGKVVKYRRSVTLEPMNAYERHVIHTALQKVPGVTTYSTGVDPNRRVIVAYDREKK